MIKKSRLDLYLLKTGLCETRQKAQGLILAGKVRDINGKVLDKPGHQVLIGSEFFIDSEPMFVSRGGEKLMEAFNKKQILIFYKDNPIRSFRHSLSVLKLKTTKTFQKKVIIIQICSMASTSLMYRAIMRF